MDKVVIFLLAAALLFLVVRDKPVQETYEKAPVPVDRDTISLIITAVQEKQPGWVPIDTVYVNPVVDERGASLGRVCLPGLRHQCLQGGTFHPRSPGGSSMEHASPGHSICITTLAVSVTFPDELTAKVLGISFDSTRRLVGYVA